MTDLDAGLAPEQAAVLAARLGVHGWRLATAESCTGGLIAAACTDRAGSSEWFERGYVTYSNAAKTELLGVPAAALETHGAVSLEVAAAMAEGAARQAGVPVALSVTGIAGPGGGTPAKPVGTVCFGWRLPDGRVETDRRRFFGERAAVRAAAMRYALDGLIKRLGGA